MKDTANSCGQWAFLAWVVILTIGFIIVVSV